MKTNYNLLPKGEKEKFNELFSVNDIPKCELKCYTALYEVKYVQSIIGTTQGKRKTIVFIKNTPKKKIIDTLTSCGVLLIYGINDNDFTDISDELDWIYEHIDDKNNHTAVAYNFIYEIIRDNIEDNIDFYNSTANKEDDKNRIKSNFSTLKETTKRFLQHCTKLSLDEFKTLLFRNRHCFTEYERYLDYRYCRQKSITIEDDIIGMLSICFLHTNDFNDKVSLMGCGNNTDNIFVIYGISKEDMCIISDTIDTHNRMEDFSKIKEIFDYIVNSYTEAEEAKEKDEMIDDIKRYYIIIDNKHKYPTLIESKSLDELVGSKDDKKYNNSIIISLSSEYNNNVIEKVFQDHRILLYNIIDQKEKIENLPTLLNFTTRTSYDIIQFLIRNSKNVIQTDILFRYCAKYIIERNDLRESLIQYIKDKFQQTIEQQPGSNEIKTFIVNAILNNNKHLEIDSIVKGFLNGNLFSNEVKNEDN